MAASELAEILNVSLPRIASLVNTMETKKLVEKTIDSADKRKIDIHITEQGRELVLEKKEEAINRITKVIEKLDEEDINQYIRLAKKIGRIMEEMQD